jgi:hypothetical protein
MEMMIKNKSALFTILFSVLFSFQSAAQSYDFGTWWGFEIRKKLPKNFSASFESEIRLNENSLFVRNIFIEPSVSYEVLKWLSLVVQYRFDNRYQREDDYFLQRHRISFDINISYPIKRFTLDYRNRTQIEWENYFAPDIHYPSVDNRNMIGATFKWPNLPFRTYAQNEIWIPLTSDEFNISRYRLTIGQEWAYQKIHRFQIRYLMQLPPNDASPNIEQIISVRYILALK